MFAGWGYRSVVAVGTVMIACVVTVMTLVVTGSGLTPSFDRSTLTTVTLVSAVVGMAFLPLYTPRPWHVFSLIRRTGQQVVIACLVLVSLGVVGVGTVPEPAMILLLGLVLAVVLPAWYWLCGRRGSIERALIVGDNRILIDATRRSLPTPSLGFLSPTPIGGDDSIMLSHSSDTADGAPTPEDKSSIATDGGVSASRVDSLDIERLSGLSRLGHVLCERDVDTVALAFAHGDREECFGVLRTCRHHGVDVVAHESLSDKLLAGEQVGEELVRVDLEPWSWYGRALKRAFDVTFATIGLATAAPLLVVIAIAIKLDSDGPVFYCQRRTAELGGTFPVWKFRTMLPESEDETPQEDEDIDRITDVGRVLRKTHLDEIPQLLSILVGDMSVVGPRAAWVEEERVLEREIDGWQQRWAVTPGLTGLAQIKHASSTDGDRKLAYDLEYIRRQSLRLDVTIVLVQIWMVVRDVGTLVWNKLVTSNS